MGGPMQRSGLLLMVALLAAPHFCSAQNTTAATPAPATPAPAAPAPAAPPAPGEWVERFRAPTGGWFQRTIQLYGDPASISDDGAVVVVGCQTSSRIWEARIFREATPSAGDFALEATIPSSGFAASLSAGGGRVALSDVYANNYRGSVVVLAWDGLEWSQVGNRIDGDEDMAMAGFSVALSGDGNTLVVGSKHHPGGGRARGRVDIYRLSVDGARWELALSQAGDADSFRLGHAVSIDRSGTRILASGAVEERSGASAYAFELSSGGAWARAGTVLPPPSAGTAQLTGFGSSISSASDGSMAAVAAWWDVVDLPRGRNGRVSFHPASPLGEQRPDITYAYPNGMFGASVSMSGDGSIVAIGTNSFLGGIYTYAWDAQASQWAQINAMPVSTSTALGRTLSLTVDGRRMVYLERTSRQLVVADLVQ